MKEPSINVKRGWIPMDFKHSLKCLWNPEKVYRSRNRCWCHRVCHRTTDSKTFPNYSTCQTHHRHQVRSLPELSGFGHMMKYVEIWWKCCEHVVKYGEIRQTWQFPVPDHAYNSPIIGSTQSAFSDIESSIWRPLGVKLHQNSLSWYPGVNEHRCTPLFVDRFPTETPWGFSTSFCKLSTFTPGFFWAETESFGSQAACQGLTNSRNPLGGGLWSGHIWSCFTNVDWGFIGHPEDPEDPGIYG